MTLPEGDTANYRPVRLPPTDAAALATLVDLARDRALTPDGRAIVPEAEWREACIAGRRVSAAASEKGRGDVFRRAYSGLIEKGRIGAAGGFVWAIAAIVGDSSAIVASRNADGGGDSSDSALRAIAIARHGSQDVRADIEALLS